MRTIQRPSIFTQSPESLGQSFTASSSSLAYPAANDALFVPFFIQRPILAQRMFCVNGATASGNIDLGIYTKDGAKIVSIGSTAQAGTTTIQFFNITDTYLSPGQYYMAVAKNDTTGTLRRLNVLVVRQQMLGVFKMATAFVLPATATFATPTAAYIPMIGIELVGLK